MPAVIRHIPHASTAIPFEYRHQFVLDDGALDRELLAMTDRHTDALFASGDPKIDLLFPVSRLLVDVERFEDDAQEMMASIGMGMLYEKTHGLRPLRHTLSHAERDELLERFYRPHHRELTARVEAALAEHSHALVIDCHSYPSHRLPYEVFAPDSARPEVCLGADDFHTPAPLVDAAAVVFSKAGFDVAVNTPFAGTITPTSHFQKDPRVHSIMIELRRDIYMDETTGRQNERFRVIQTAVSAACEALALASDRIPRGA